MKQVLLLLFFCLPFLGIAQVEAELLGTWSDNSITPTSFYDSRYNDVWGDTINGLEIAIIGSTDGTHFIDVTDPTTPTEIAFVAGQAQGTSLVHRDFHSYNGYLYAVADEGASSLQVIDMRDLPNSVEVVYDSDELLSQAHNIFIDTSRAMLYACNGNGFELRLISLADPENPSFVASYPAPGFLLPQIHDMFVQNDTAFLNGAFQGLLVVDFSSPNTPALLGTMTSYPQSGYNHSGWLSEDGNHYYMLDETHGKDIKTVDVADFTDMSVTALFNAESTSLQIPHNAIVKGDYLYVSYYFDGLQVFDVSDPNDPERVAYYDTYVGDSNGGFRGAWGIYPLLPSGNILLSDMNNGLFVFADITNIMDFSLNSDVDEINSCVEETVSFTLTIGEDFSEDGVNLSINDAPADANITFSSNPVMPGDEVEVTLTNLQQSGDFALVVTATDGINSGTTVINLILGDAPAVVALQVPANEATQVALTPVFDWSNTLSTDNYTLEISTSSTDFDANIEFSATSVVSSFEFTDELMPNNYFWRVQSNNECGSSVSEIFTFTTENFDAVDELTIDGLAIYPNPAFDWLSIEMSPAVPANYQLSILNMQGQTLQQMVLKDAQKIAVADFPKGVYWLRFANEQGVLLKKILIL